MKKGTKKAVVKKTEIVVHVQAHNAPAIPTTNDLSEPIRDGKSLTIPKTWLSEKQITRMVEKTPKQYVYKRPGKGGGTWDYVTVSYVQRVLDYCFGFNWDFEIVEHGKEADHVWVLGRLIVRNPESTQQIIKTQFGRSEVKTKKGGGNLDYGNDLKAAASDALKKCASMLGIARDIYGKTDYKQESGITPREASEAVVQLNEPAATNIICHGPNGKGCKYGNDAEPLSEQTANYSKKVYGRAMCIDCQKDAQPLKK